MQGERGNSLRVSRAPRARRPSLSPCFSLAPYPLLPVKNTNSVFSWLLHSGNGTPGQNLMGFGGRFFFGGGRRVFVTSAESAPNIMRFKRFAEKIDLLGGGWGTGRPHPAYSWLCTPRPVLMGLGNHMGCPRTTLVRPASCTSSPAPSYFKEAHLDFFRLSTLFHFCPF